MNLSQYAPWLGFGFMFGCAIWAAVYVVTALRRALAIGAGFNDV